VPGVVHDPFPWEEKVIQKSSYFDQQVLLALSEHLTSGGYSGPLYNMTLALLGAPALLTPATKWSQLTEASYTGYARQTGLTWGVPLLQPDGTYQILSALTTWIAAAGSNFVNGVIYGWALLDTSATPDLLLSEMFASTIPIISPNDGFGLVIQISEGINNPASMGNVIQ
jgi:hypothetical protein